MSAHQLVRRYVALVAQNSPLTPRLRKLKGPKVVLAYAGRSLPTGESEALADIIDRATSRVCDGGDAYIPKPLRGAYSKAPHFISGPPQMWLFFQHGPGDVRTMLLCYYALDAVRKEHETDTDTSGGAPLDPKKPALHAEAQDNLARFTDAGDNPLSIERQLQRDAEEAALNARVDIEAEEDARLCAAGVEYFHTRKNPKHRQVFHAICRDITETDKAIKKRFGVAAKTVSDIRKKLESLAEEFQTAPPEEGAPVEVPTTAPDVPYDGMLTQIADAVEGVTVYLAETINAPEIDGELDGGASEKTLRSYRRRDSGFATGSSKREYSDRALITGREKRWDNDPENQMEIALRAERTLMENKSAEMVQAMQELATKFGVPLEALLNSATVHLALRSTDATLSNTIRGPKRSEQ